MPYDFHLAPEDIVADVCTGLLRNRAASQGHLRHLWIGIGVVGGKEKRLLEARWPTCLHCCLGTARQTCLGTARHTGAQSRLATRPGTLEHCCRGTAVHCCLQIIVITCVKVKVHID